MLGRMVDLWAKKAERLGFLLDVKGDVEASSHIDVPRWVKRSIFGQDVGQG